MFTPIIDSYLTIDLPGEKLRALVKKVINNNKIILQLTNQPLAKSHTYRKDDFVACIRKEGMFGEMWEVVESKPSLDDFVEQVNVVRFNAKGRNAKVSGNKNK